MTKEHTLRRAKIETADQGPSYPFNKVGVHPLYIELVLLINSFYHENYFAKFGVEKKISGVLILDFQKPKQHAAAELEMVKSIVGKQGIAAETNTFWINKNEVLMKYDQSMVFIR